MAFTRHTVIVAFVVGITILGVSAATLIKSGSESVTDETEGMFIEEVRDYGALPTEESNKNEVRESLLSKLQEEGAGSNGEELVEEETEVIEGVPLGDGNVSSLPLAGHVYACSQQFGGGGTHADGDWISDGYWYPEEKVAVDGTAVWINDVSITAPEGARVINANGLPDHGTGNFPISTSDEAYQYDRNPGEILAQHVTLQLPQYPAVAVAPSCVPVGMIGIGLNGVAIYNALDARGQDAPAHEIQDECGGHPEATGQYHYHNESECLLASAAAKTGSNLVGYAIDGFGIYSSIEDGEKVTNDDLDECHGHDHIVEWDGTLRNIFHYHMTDEYPYTIGCFRGTPVETRRESLYAAPPGEPAPINEPPPDGSPPPPNQL